MNRPVLITMGVAAVALSVLLQAAPNAPVADAAQQGDREAVRTLLKQAADVNGAQGDGMTALHWAAMKNDAELAKMLLYAGANARAMTRIGNYTPLLLAAKNGQAAVMTPLLAAGADVNATTSNGTTALMLAAGLGWRNGSPLAPSYDQGTDAEAVETLELLLSLGLDLEATNQTGDTALHAAVAGRGSEAIVRFLLERGADPLAANGRQQTPLSIAEARGSNAIKALVRAAAGEGE
jgi:uncharacterized protein